MQDLLTENGVASARTKTADIAHNEKITPTAVLQSIGHGLIVLADIDKGGRIVYVNKTFETMTGWKAKEVLNKYAADALPRKDKSGQAIAYKEQVLAKVMAGEKVIADLHDPCYFPHRNKTTFPIASITSPIVFKNTVIGAVETFRDITKECAADKVKTEFASLVSHQLRTPFSTINWYIELLLSGDAGKLNDQQAEYLNEVYRASKRMVDLDNLLLNTSRIEMGLATSEVEQVNIITLAEIILRERKLESQKKKLKIHKTFDKSIPLIQVDPKQLSMIFENLLSNAIKYTPPGGKIKLYIGCKSDTKDAIDITVTDTGIGIPKADQPKIFSRFFRADNAKTQDGGIGGLGLYILKAAVDQLGGKVWFDSQENKGTTFYVTIPLKAGLKKSKAGL